MRLINWRCPVQGMTNKWNTSTNNSTLPFRTFPLCHKMPRRFVCRLPYYLSIISSRRSFCWLHVPCINNNLSFADITSVIHTSGDPDDFHCDGILPLLFKPHSNVFAIFILITTNWSCVDFWLKVVMFSSTVAFLLYNWGELGWVKNRKLKLWQELTINYCH